MITANLKLQHRLFFYVTIGGFAALTHLFIVFQLVSHLAWNPLYANIVGFLIAFNISYIGHKYLTFAQLENEAQLSLPHFFLIACSSAALNEFFYFLLLKYTSLNYILALILVLGTIAIYTFVVSRLWGCR